MKTTPYMYRCSRHECTVDLYLASIDVKSEDSILLEETVTRRHCILKEICGAVCVV